MNRLTAFSVQVLLCAFSLFFSCQSKKSESVESPGQPVVLTLVQNEQEGTLSVFREGENTPILVENARDDHRPYIHPWATPDGKGFLTQYSPDHHKHQTGLYWGFTRVNGRDYFHNPSDGYWKKIASNVLEEKGEVVKWQTVYELLGENGGAVLEETQTWSLREVEGQFLLDLEWKGFAKTNLTIGKYDYGGLFLRMPWKEGISGEIINAARQKNQQAEGQPAMWINVGMQVEGREDWADVAIFDHPDNHGYPNKWRVDGQLGLGPAYTRDADWEIDSGATFVLKHRLLAYTGKPKDLDLTNAWAAFSGKQGMYNTTELWALAQQEGRNAKFLTPQEAADAMTLKPGYQVNVWAGEPMMTQPMAFCWDDRGRLWIAENKDYESRGHGFSNSGKSRILILEDTDRDGAADKQTVFAEGLAFPAAIAVGFDGVFVGAPPNLLFIPDRNGDDKAEMKDVEILLTGWGIRDRHETLNSLHWGPDGWLYGLEGFATPSKIRKPAKDTKLYFHKDPFPENLLEAEGVDVNGGVWRYHPVKKEFEVVAHGFSNPWGIDYDAKGQLFISACVIPHLWHVVPGGIYHRQGGQHFNPYVYEDIKTITNHSHRSAHGGARIYQSDAFPTEEKGKIFMANIHEHAILSDVLVPEGSSFVGEHGDEFLMANNAQWVGFSMEIGPDGGLYALDWHDADICGQEVLNEETGRIFRVMPEKSLAENFSDRYKDLNTLSDEKLVDFQTGASDWHARRARGILYKRAVKGTLKPETNPKLKAIFQNHKNSDFRLKVMWALHQTGGWTVQEHMKNLEDKDPYVRAWAIQLLCENRKPGKAALQKFSTMAKNDTSPVVRLYLAAALQRISDSEKWVIAENLLQHKEDAEDHNIPKMLWFGTESWMNENPGKYMAMASQAKIPLMIQYSARKAMDTDQMEPLMAVLDKSGVATVELLKGMLAGMEGRSDLKTPANWKGISQKLEQKSGEIKGLSQEISALFGDKEAAQKALATLKNKNASLDQRQKALQMLAAQQQTALVAEIPNLLQEPKLRKDAIASVASYDNESLGKLVLSSYSSFSPEEKMLAVQTLATRSRYGNLLMNAIKANQISKKDIPANVARQLLRVVGSGFIEVWGPIETVAKDQAAYHKYQEILNKDALAKGDLKAGKSVFLKTCGSCHKMFGEGGAIGPDLTGSNRTDVNYLLLNVLEPSAEIQDDYKMVIINTRDGRTYSGNVTGENSRQISLRVVGQADPVLINKSSIQSKEETDVSMMPPGLFENLDQKEIVDLVAYLGSLKKVE